jgi:TRAP transporter TAXI family solute receptor
MKDNRLMSTLSAGRFLGLAAIAIFAFSVAAAAETRRDLDSIRGVVELETDNASGISVRIAEDLANIVDDGATRRLLPVVGKGALQNVTDLRLMHGVDMAILQQDVVDYLRRQKRGTGFEDITYIAKLYNEEFHLLARPDIVSLADLAGKRVNVDLHGGGTAITATRVFDLLRVPVLMTYDDQQAALRELQAGTIAAVAYVTGKPAPLFRDLRPEQGFHFIALPLDPRIDRAYTAAQLTAKDYPDLVRPDQPVDTVAVGTVLAVANLSPGTERYRNVANFVDTFFTQFDSLLDRSRHPKWAEVSLDAEVPGWRRFPPAEQWLKRNASPPVASGGRTTPADLQLVFQRFLEQRLQGQGMTKEQKDDLFAEFERWQAGRAH